MVHLWWWEECHAPGETAEEARRNLAAVSGEPVERCGDLDEWEKVPDDTVMCDENGEPMSPTITAQRLAETMARHWGAQPANAAAE